MFRLRTVVSAMCAKQINGVYMRSVPRGFVANG